jgi:putative mRNA 3-end processing factor
MLAKDTLKIAQANGVYAPYNSEDLHKFVQRTTAVDTGVEFTTQGYKVEFYDAGHIPGAASIRIESKSGESLFYTDILQEKKLSPHSWIRSMKRLTSAGLL